MQTGMKRTAVHLQEITQIALTVNDLNRATEFYRDTLGMTFLFEAGQMAFFQCGTMRLMIGLAEKPVAPASTIVYFKVADIRAAHTTLQEQGVTFLEAPHLIARMPDHDLWLSVFADPDGNTLALMSEQTQT